MVANLYLPALNARIIDRGLTQGRTDVIWQTDVVMLVIALGQGVVAAGAAYIGARTATGLGRDLRAEVFRAVGRFSSREMREFGTASLITRTTNDVQQIQMLVLMRALVARPSIYLFDDAFSALDLSTEDDLREALRPYARHATTFIAAQRISTICSADQIVVLEAGEVQGIGTHEELLTSCPTYGEIVASQLAEEVTA